MNDRDKKVKVLLEDESISVETFNDIISYFSENEQNILLILRGLLRFDVLKLVLTKRWRVNYGVNVKSARKMAVPFKAKDVAAENTEFGHPDLAICLTHLSYYYSGKLRCCTHISQFDFSKKKFLRLKKKHFFVKLSEKRGIFIKTFTKFPEIFGKLMLKLDT